MATTKRKRTSKTSKGTGHVPYYEDDTLAQAIETFQSDNLYPLDEQLAIYQNHVLWQAIHLSNQNRNTPNLDITQHLQVSDILGEITRLSEDLNIALDNLTRLIKKP